MDGPALESFATPEEAAGRMPVATTMAKEEVGRINSGLDPADNARITLDGSGFSVEGQVSHSGAARLLFDGGDNHGTTTIAMVVCQRTTVAH